MAESSAAIARGLALQLEELQRQVAQQGTERGRLEADLARLRAEHGALAETPMVYESPMAPAERWVGFLSFDSYYIILYSIIILYFIVFISISFQ